MAGGAVTAGGGILAVGAAVLVALISALPLALSGAVPGSAGGSIAASPVSSGPGSTVSDIPPTYLAAFDRAAGTYGVAWSVLAGIYKVECDFGRSPLPGCPRGTRNSAGAEGPGQFLPSTWRRGLALGTIIARQGRRPPTGRATPPTGTVTASPTRGTPTTRRRRRLGCWPPMAQRPT